MKTFFLLLVPLILIVAGCGNNQAGDQASQTDSNKQSGQALSKVVIVDNCDSLVSSLEDLNEGDTLIIVDLVAINKKLILKNKKNLVIIGDYGMVQCFGCPENVIEMDSCEHIIIENLSFNNGSEDTVSHSIFHIKASKNIVFQNNTIGKNTHYAVRLSKDCDSILFSENIVHDCIDAGVEVLAPSTILANNTFFNNGDGTKDLIFGKKIEEKTTLQDNEFLTADHSDYVKSLDQLVLNKNMKKIQVLSADSTESTTGFYRNNQISMIEYQSIKEGKTEKFIYLKDEKPLYILEKSTSVSSESEGKSQTSENAFYFLHDKLVKWVAIVKETNEIKTELDKKILVKKQRELQKSFSNYLQTIKIKADNN